MPAFQIAVRFVDCVCNPIAINDLCPVIEACSNRRGDSLIPVGLGKINFTPTKSIPDCMDLLDCRKFARRVK